MPVPEALERARLLVRLADDEGAKRLYLEVLREDPTHLGALNELGNLALAGGFRSAARTAYLQAIAHHPGSATVRVNLANVLREDRDPAGARVHYEAALAIDPQLHEAHQGMAWVLAELGLEGAEFHRQRGYAGRALVTQPYRGSGAAPSILLLVSALGGNIPTRLWIDDRRFTIHALYPEYFDPAAGLPPHELIMNAIGDADLCTPALERAEHLVTRSCAPVVNPPARVRETRRADIVRRLAGIPGVLTPRIEVLQRRQLLETPPPAAVEALGYPLLLRSPGFHTGRHFVQVESDAALEAAAASLPGEQLLAIEYLDARGSDGMARKYRVMFVDGRLYPLHLAISADWKVHYFSADMARSAVFREEERRFLENMPAMLGPAAMQALERIESALGLQYAGIDFALSPDGEVLLFEANATMVVFPPGPEPHWEYRRAPIAAVLEAARRMLDRHGGWGDAPGPADRPSRAAASPRPRHP